MVFLFLNEVIVLKKIVLIVLFLLVPIISGQSADAATMPSIDFEISHEMNMIGSVGSNEVQMEPLIIENNSDLYAINVSDVHIDALNSWELVEKDMDFGAMKEGEKKISVSTIEGEDFANGGISAGEVGSKEKMKINFQCKISKTAKTEEPINVANIVVDIVPSFDCQTVFYEDGTLIINELLTESDRNVELHGAVKNTYAPWGPEESYIFTSSSQRPWYDIRKEIKRVEIGSYIKPKSLAYWFYYCPELSYVDTTNLDTSSATSTHMMFYYAGRDVRGEFKIIGLDDWNVSNIKSFAGMFNQCGFFASNFDIGDLSQWDMSSAENISSMFYLTGIYSGNWYVGDLSNWDVSNVKYFISTFRQAGQHSKVFTLGDLGSWDTSSAVDMTYMFYNAGTDAEKTTIGSIKIPAGCDIQYFMGYCGNMQATVHIGGIPVADNNSFYAAATAGNSSIQLIPSCEDTRLWCEKTVEKYGIEGTITKGNVWI